MRLLLATLAALLALAAPAVASAPTRVTIQPGPSSVRITDLLIEKHSVNHGAALVRTFLLYNKAITKHSIGHSVLFCTHLGKGGVLGSGQDYCREQFTLARGTLLAEGIISTNQVFYDLAITGGTGIYANVGAGDVSSAITKLVPREDNVIMQLYAT